VVRGAGRWGPGCGGIRAFARLASERVVQVMRERAQLAPVRRLHRHADGRHDWTIIPEAPHRRWGPEATRAEAEPDDWG